jgi:hypothetical protein
MPDAPGAFFWAKPLLWGVWLPQWLAEAVTVAAGRPVIRGGIPETLPAMEAIRHNRKTSVFRRAFPSGHKKIQRLKNGFSNLWK